jgi:hypothetical protein
MSIEQPFLLGVRFKNAKQNITIPNNLKTPCSLLDIQLLFSCDSRSDVDSCVMTKHVPRYAIETQPTSIDEYALYSQIENHMNISMSLFDLNKQGQQILQELGCKKLNIPMTVTKMKKTVSQLCKPSDMHTIYQNLSEIINFNRTSIDAYTELLSILDDALFKDSCYLKTFYVGETEYNLEALYYKQLTWISELEWHEKAVYEFSESKILDLGESSYLLMFLNTYMDVICKIKEHMHIHERVMLHIEKINNKILTVREIMYNLVLSKLNDE